jgi:hypothetical protein
MAFPPGQIPPGAGPPPPGMGMGPPSNGMPPMMQQQAPPQVTLPTRCHAPMVPRIRRPVDFPRHPAEAQLLVSNSFSAAEGSRSKGRAWSGGVGI